jgi:hypothetical protein
MCEVRVSYSGCAAAHLEPAFTDDRSVFTDAVHNVVMINGFLLLIYISDANLHARKRLYRGCNICQTQTTSRLREFQSPVVLHFNILVFRCVR